MTEAHKSPCEDCSRPCNYTQCKDYRLWLNRCWNRYRRWPEQWRIPRKKDDGRHFRYDSPMLLHDFLEKGPCAKCPARICCADDEYCEAFEAWLHLRWKYFRALLHMPSHAISPCAQKGCQTAEPAP